MENNREVLLKVDHLCQYFRLGRKDLKAVDNVSFEDEELEAAGIVGPQDPRSKNREVLVQTLAELDEIIKRFRNQ